MPRRPGGGPPSGESSNTPVPNHPTGGVRKNLRFLGRFALLCLVSLPRLWLDRIAMAKRKSRENVSDMKTTFLRHGDLIQPPILPLPEGALEAVGTASGQPRAQLWVARFGAARRCRCAQRSSRDGAAAAAVAVTARAELEGCIIASSPATAPKASTASRCPKPLLQPNVACARLALQQYLPSLSLSLSLLNAHPAHRTTAGSLSQLDRAQSPLSLIGLL